MDDPLETRTLGDYLRVLSARRRLIIGIALAAAAAALVFSVARTPVYEANATIAFTRDFFPQGQPLPGATSPSVAAGVEIVTRGDVAARVSKALGDDLAADELTDAVTTSADSTSGLVVITASDENADRAAELANEFAAQTRIVTRNEVRDFYQSRIDTNPDAKDLANLAEPVEVIRPATPPSSPSSPKPIRDTVIAAFLGLLLGIGAAFVRQSLDRRITDAHQVQDDLDLPLVGYVRREALGAAGLSLNGSRLSSDEDFEAFRILRANVDFLARGEEARALAVTSPVAEEGKSTVAAGYAYANALAGRSTILVECDFRRPVLAERFGFDSSPGLSDHLIGEATPKDVLRSIDVEGPTAAPLPVVPAGLSGSQPAELLASPAFEQFLSQIIKVYERVVLDCPPLLPVGDTLEVLPQVDAVLLCLRVGQTTMDQARAAKETMSHLPERPTGLVITGLQRGGEDDYYGYYSRAIAPAGAPSENAP